MHWYTQSGEPCYEVPCTSKEGMRPTTIKDARKLNLVPSVTEILNIEAKPALDMWKANQILEAALKAEWRPKAPIQCLEVSEGHLKVIRPVPNYEDLEYKKKTLQWKGMVLGKSKEISVAAAKRGNEIHDALEQVFIFNNHNIETLEFTQPIEVLLRQEPFMMSSPLISESSFAHELGFGGRVDLHGDGFILDFKTKDKIWDNKEQLAYDGHCMQLAAYRVGLGKAGADCYNLFISTKEPGLIKLHKWTEEELLRGWEMFMHLLSFWKLKNNF